MIEREFSSVRGTYDNLYYQDDSLSGVDIGSNPVQGTKYGCIPKWSNGGNL